MPGLSDRAPTAMNNVHDSRPQRDHCVSCLTPTGLRTAVEGKPTWILRLLLRLGLPRDRAQGVVAGQAGGPMLDRRVTRMFPICGECALYTGFKTALAVDGWDDDFPVIRQPVDGG
jgi:hypothetical protein